LADRSDQPILIAYSGGVDSQVLLNALVTLKSSNKIQNTLRVCHVNHGLSANAEKWQQFAVQQCQIQGVELSICAVNIERKNQQSLEALARDARYRALQNTAKKLADKNVIIMTGHHQDDQCETFLLALKRGSGLKGLSAMSPSAKLGDHLLARPLLNCSRADIEHYANIKKLTWVEDESNKETRFDRNFLRQNIIPLLTQRWPSINVAIERSSQHCQDGQALIEELAQIDLKTCLTGNDNSNEPVLAVTPLLKLSSLRINNLLRYFIAQQGLLMPSREQLKQITQQLTAITDKSPHINVGDYSVRRFKEHLFITKKFVDLHDVVIQLPLDISNLNKVTIVNETIKLPDGLGQLQLNLKTDNFILEKTNNKKIVQIKAPVSNEHITIRFSHNNPRCLPDYRQHSRPLKKILQELNIAPWQRKRIPFIYYNDTLVAALGLFVCKDFVSNTLFENHQPVIEINWLVS